MPFKPVSPAPLQPHAGGDGGNGHESRCPPTGAPGAAPQASAAAEAPSRRPLCLVPGREPVGLFEFPSVQAGRGFCAYTPPCTISYDYDAPAGGSMVQQIFISPAGPGRSIVLTGTLDVRADGKTDANAPRASGPRSPLAALVSALGRLMSSLWPPPAAWRSCLSYNLVFDQDNAFLHAQDVLLKARGPGAWRSYYTPLQSDRLISAARRWIEEQAGGGPDFGGAPLAPPAPLPKRVVNDRWSQHTAECSHCAAAAARLTRGVGLAKVAAAALFAAFCGLLGTFGAPGLLARAAGPGLVAAAAAAGACSAAWWARRAEALLREFQYVEFSHAQNP
ncbi:hypothetical protein MNEG_6492 [Monoraphidium neglectum]|uniref:Pheophorbide a oxygenase domain-containing protein n=1 Tax=Monoraphidium neglectum TaxID=145388 RepID=A0A0D2N6C3_9CHLO|nr:hypothetical protein MNEG_6492 [Monoraphidium neglectum]KIZ01471.1 hypothetical protein MNEG_6492 [Monoraphidium neglectum]|eukprot:XP_013900490.1 hypothetical protein MNEG_6492 [Monoraphidium neglectum]